MFAEASLTQAETLRRWLAKAIFFLLAITFMDAVISVDFYLGAGREAAFLIALSYTPICAALLTMLVQTPKRFPRAPSDPEPAQAPKQSECIEALTQLMEQRALYRDPDLSLSRLSRRLGVPARQLSEAINRTFGCSVSHYVNALRIRYAGKLLLETDLPVAQIMEQSGFQTKSNFNREFQRVLKTTPTSWRADRCNNF